MNQKYGFAALLCTLLCAACGDEGTPANTTTEPDTGGRPTGDVGTIPDEDDARSPDAATDAGLPDIEADSASPVEDATVPPDDAIDGGDPDAEPEDDTATPDTFAPDASGAALGSPCESNAECASGLCIDTTGGVGRPTPEGAHRDGVDFVVVMLVGRQGVKGGETRVFDAHGPHGVRFEMAQPLTALLLDDTRVIHETTPILPTGEPAGGFRDTLVLTYRAAGFQAPG